ncbi:MAG TPA: hypothetical protein VN131_00600 [Mobilitalea sp.]|nr:hypothetical protein [Mobilitalea sp.]
MKTNNITDATKVLILVATIIVVCVLCAVGFKMTNEGRSAVNASTNNLNNMTSQYQDIDKAIYDGAMVQGSEVDNFIKRVLGGDEYLSVVVKTKANHDVGVAYKYDFNEVSASNSSASLGATNKNSLPTAKGNKDYINPNAQFSGKVYKDANDVIICIEFVQL